MIQRNQLMNFELKTPIENTWDGVYYNEQIYRNLAIGYVLPKSIKTAEKEFTMMGKHIEITSITLYSQSSYETPGKELVIINKYIITRPLPM